MVQDFSHQLLVLQLLPCLHDPDDRSLENLMLFFFIRVFIVSDLDEQLPILLYVLVGELHLLPLLRLHGNVDVHLK